MATPQDELQALRAELAALTARIYRLEQQAGVDIHSQPEPRIARPPAERVTAPTPAPPPSHASGQQWPPLRIASTKPTLEAEQLENKIGKLWLNRIGIIAILIGVSYFIKYAFDNGWIGPTGRIALGLLAGIGLVLWSERFRGKGYIAFSYSLKAVGIGTLYLSLWGAFQIYHLVPGWIAFAAMIVVTACTITLALAQDAEILAAFALIGGFSTPVLLSTGQNHEIVLFSYGCLLDLSSLAMVAFKPWRRLLVGSFIGTATLFIGWFAEYYTQDQRATTVFFAMVFAVIFAVSPLLTPLTKSRWHSGLSITLALLPLVNATALFLALFAMYDSERGTLAWYALGLAAAYLVLSGQLKRRAGSDADVVRTINLLHIAIAIAFITTAIPLKLNTHWITIGWLIESAVLLFVAVRTATDFLRYFAAATLTLGIMRLLVYGNFHVQTPVLNARFATYLVAIGILGGIVGAGERFATEGEKPFVRFAGVILNLLALIALTLEVSDYFGRQLTYLYQTHQYGRYETLQQIEFARNFSYSAIWLAYGVGMMTFGFWRRSAFVRWQALALIAFTIGKVFLYDVSMLQQGYRILSFIALGVVLMGISYIYHRDWLKLSSRAQENSTQRTAS
jgi:uncharacterized membrane protein